MTSFVHQTVSSTSRYRGPIFEVFSDEVTMSGGGTAKRDVVRNKGAVGVVALDEVDRVVLIKQYRHAVGRRLWELPAGLRDVDGEDLAATAARELAEEADVNAGRWDLLIDMFNSPGFSDETIRIFLARDLTEVPDAERYSRTDEEADLEVTRVDLDEAIAMIFRGEITNAAAVGGLLAAARARDEGWATLRPVT
ncbi:ADP-ribose pyrophosphatase [Paractinoplanes deccanensis]|uniref:ADP-ribose pyrophosphatase n=1 Tax=Paractinoplanes deccanensis TaxID=113561 RepID=A0ABQ3YKD5_9ACTN|nr:NUDIX hydrolase [Actinoplanes deccanensis]GID80472.1 ADP-ribose pyrophosphatase [Actinoplanes deccanensis]